MARCLLGLGSNLGDRRETLRQAVHRVSRLRGCQLLARSCWYETTPIGGPSGQGAFLNGALLLECSVSPQELATALQSIESQLGRDRAIRWDARAIDIDVLLFGSKVIESPELTVPHPRMSFRKFVLEPAAEIAGFLVDPVSGWTLRRLLRYLQDAPRYVAVASEDAAIAAWLAEGLCQELRCVRLEETYPAPRGAGDSDASATVEFTPWALAALGKSRWKEDQELSKRLPPGQGELQVEVPPVVSSFWFDESVPIQRGKPLGGEHQGQEDTLRPALVIAVEPSSEKNFRKKIREKKEKNSQLILPDLPQSSFRESLKRMGQGPVARIQADDPAVVLQEAIAAIRSIWPELSVASKQEFS